MSFNLNILLGQTNAFKYLNSFKFQNGGIKLVEILIDNTLSASVNLHI